MREERKQPPQLCEGGRDRLAHAVFELLDQEDKILALEGKPGEIKWAKYKRGRGPLAGAVKRLMAEDELVAIGEGAREFLGRKPEALRKGAKKWFLRKYSKADQDGKVCTIPI